MYGLNIISLYAFNAVLAFPFMASHRRLRLGPHHGNIIIWQFLQDYSEAVWCPRGGRARNRGGDARGLSRLVAPAARPLVLQSSNRNPAFCSRLHFLRLPLFPHYGNIVGNVGGDQLGTLVYGAFKTVARWGMM